MKLGFIGAGNMARALARGWGEPVLATDGGSGRAAELAAELGGEAIASNAELAERCDAVLLAHKPAQLDDVAAEVAGRVDVVVSVLAWPPAAIAAAYPEATVVCAMPNTAVEVGQGVTCLVVARERDASAVGWARERFGAVGTVHELPEHLMFAATATSGVAPAYVALLAEAQIDAAVKHGLPAPIAAELVIESLAGTAALLRARGHDTLAVRREVTSPGGATARGLAALERGGVRAAFVDAIDAVLGGR